MQRHFLIGAFCAVLTSIVLLGAHATADPLPGEVLKFYQTPLNNGLPIYPPGSGPSAGDVAAPFPGHDEISTATLNPSSGQYSGQYMADDFSDNFDTPIVHVMWWGSYLNGSNLTGAGATKFLVTFETDVAAGDPNNQFPYSHPGTVISSQVVTLGALAPHSGTFTETLVPSGAGIGVVSPDGPLYQYNAELAIPAPEHHGTVEWIKIVALKDDPAQQWLWGWHNRDYGIHDPLASPIPVPGEFSFPTGLTFPPLTGWHFQDDAVSGPLTIVPGPGGLVPIQTDYAATSYIPAVDGISFSKDLAFALYTTNTPEPSSAVLFVIGSVALVMTGWRRHRAR